MIFVSCSIAHLACIPTNLYVLLSPPHVFCTIADIPVRRDSPSVVSSSSASLEANWNSFQYSVIVSLPCEMCFSLLLSYSFLSIMPYWLLSASVNCCHVSQVGLFKFSMYGVFHVSASPLNKLVVYVIFSWSWSLAHPISMK